MPIHNMDINSKPDCQELINRIRGTLAAVRPNVLDDISYYPQPFLQNDKHIFERLTWAVLSNGTKYYLLEPQLPAIKRILFNYNLTMIANLSNSAIDALYLHQIKPLKIPSRQKLETKLRCIRDNANIFLQIQGKHGSVWHFIETNIGETPFDHSHGCYIHPKDDDLLKWFSRGSLKLSGVGLPICCEFFNGIGIDEFKPDTHTRRFLSRVDIVKLKEPNEVRKAGNTIARTLEQPRKFVDSHVWVFCADGEGEVCTKEDPKCHLCQLKNGQPQMCLGY